MKRIVLFAGLALLCLMPVLGVLADRTPALMEGRDVVRAAQPEPSAPSLRLF